VQGFFCQASFLDLDKIPVYHPNDEEQHIFSGKWIGPKQRLYRTKDGHKTDADVNGADNIPGKLQIPAVFANGGFS
jgi:putative transposase